MRNEKVNMLHTLILFYHINGKAELIFCDITEKGCLGLLRQPFIRIIISIYFLNVLI